MIEKAIRTKGASTVIDISVTTGSRINEISGFDKWRNRITIRIKEKPIDGRANYEIIQLFSTTFQVPAKSVRIVSGEKSTQKSIEVEKDLEVVKATLKSLSGQD